jgi:hypothetical protein
MQEIMKQVFLEGIAFDGAQHGLLKRATGGVALNGR